MIWDKKGAAFATPFEFLNDAGLLWPDHHHHLAAFQLWKAFELTGLFGDHIIGHTVQQFQTKLLVGHFAAPKAQGHLDLIALAQKLQHRPHFDVIVMLVRTRTELDFLDLNNVLLFAGFCLTLLLLILEFAKVHDLADRRLRIRRDFDKVKPCLLGHSHGARRRHDAYVFAISTDQTDLGATDAVIHTGARFALRRGVVGSAGYGLLPSFIDIDARVFPPYAVQNRPVAQVVQHLSVETCLYLCCCAANSFQFTTFLSCNRRNRHCETGNGRLKMNKSVILGAAVIVAAGLGYYQFSYVPAQQAAQEATMKAGEEAKAAEAAAAEAAAKAAEEMKAAEEAATKVAEEAAAKAAEELKAAEEAAKKAADEAAMTAEEKAAAIAEEAKAAEEAAMKAAEEAAAKVAEEAKAAADAAEKAAADAAATAADTATAAADAMDPSKLLDAANFDAAKVGAMIDGSSLDDATKATLKSAVDTAAGNPLLLQGVLDQVKAAMGL